MSNSVDERVVSMKFDNAQFERETATSMNTIDKLNKSLKFEGAGKGLSDITSAASNVNLSGLEKAVDGIASKFSVLGGIALSVIQNMTNSAISMGTTALNSILDPLVKGGQERALTIEQAKFQFQGLGMNVDDTMTSARNAVLGTAYSLADAAKAASMFGASGMRAGQGMTNSLRGIAGVAAMTGSSYEDVSNIFTKVAGQNRLMGDDLLSLSSRGINAAATIASSMHISEQAVRDLISAKGGSRISFQQFSDAMNNAFGQHATDANLTYAGSLANMHAALSRLGADVATPEYENQRKEFNALTPVIDKFHAALMPLINDIEATRGAAADNIVSFISKIDLTEFTMLIPHIVTIVHNLEHAVTSLIQPMKDAFSFVFPEKNVGVLTQIVFTIERFTSHLKLSEDTAFNLKRTFLGVFALFDIGRIVIIDIINVFRDLYNSTGHGSTGFLEFTANIGDFLLHVDEVLRSGSGLTAFMTKLEAVLRIPLAVLGALGTAIDWLGKKLSAAGSSSGNEFIAIWQEIGNIFKAIWKVVEPTVLNVIKFTEQMGEKVKNAFLNMKFPDLLSVLNIVSLTAFGVAIRNFYTLTRGLFSGQSKFTWISMLKTDLGSVHTTLLRMQDEIKAGVITKIAIAIGLLAASLWLLSTIQPDKLASGLIGMASIINLLVVAMKTIMLMANSMKPGTELKLLGLSTSIILIAIAVDILASAVKKLSKLSWEDLAKGLIAVVVLLGAIVATVKLMGDPKSLAATGVGMMVIAVAIDILSGAVKSLGKMSVESLAKGLGAIIIVLATLAGFMALTKKTDIGGGTAVSILIIAAALEIIADVIGRLGNMSIESLVKGVLVIAAVLATFAGFSHITGPGAILSAAAMIVISVSLLILAKALEEFGSMSWGSIAKAILVLFASMVILALGLDLMVASLPGSAALLIASAALLVLSFALKQMGDMSWAGIAKSMTMLLSVLLLFTVFLTLMILALPGAAALLVASAALAVLAVVLEAFGAMSWEAILKGLMMLSGIFIILGIAGAVLEPVVPVIFALAGAIALIGLGVALAGLGLLAFSVGLATLVTIGTAGVAIIIASVTALATLIPLILTQFAVGLVKFATTIAENMPALTAAFTTMILGFATAVNNTAPVIINTLVNLIMLLNTAIITLAPSFMATFVIFMMTVLNAVNIVGPMLINTVTILILALLNQIVTLVPAFADAGMQIITGILNGISNNMGSVISAGTTLIVSFIQGIGDNIGRIVQAGADLIVSFINALAKGITDNRDKINAAGLNLAQALIEGFTGGLKVPQSLIDNAKALAQTALDVIKKTLNINSPSRATRALAQSGVEGFTLGWLDNNHVPANAAAAMGAKALSALSDSISGASDILDGSLSTSPTIRPVLDLTDVQAGANSINGMFGSKQSISVNGSYSVAANVAQSVNATSGPTQTTVDSGQNGSGSQITYNQYNNSPKELSAIEIYRLTNQQLKTMKGALSNP